MGHTVVGWKVGILGVRRAAAGDGNPNGNQAAFVSVVESAALAVARKTSLETMTVRLRDLQAMAAIALLAMSGNLRMAGAQVAATTLIAQATPDRKSTRLN